MEVNRRDWILQSTCAQKPRVDFSLHPAILLLTFITFLRSASSVLQLLHTVISRIDQSFLGEILYSITIPLSLWQNYVRLFFFSPSLFFCTVMQAHMSSVIHSPLWVFFVITAFQMFWIILPKINYICFAWSRIVFCYFCPLLQDGFHI